jgi:hypothetical protein
MRHDVREWERPVDHAVVLTVTSIKRFAPNTWSFMEFKSSRDVDIVERLYADHEVLGDFIDRSHGRFQLEFMMNTHDRIFRRRAWLEREGVLHANQDTRDPRVRARARLQGFVPLYEGKSFWLHDPYFKGAKSQDSVSKFVSVEDIEKELKDHSWAKPRLVFRDIAASTNQRTLVAAVMPPAVHGNTGPTLEGEFDVHLLAAQLGSLTLDYIVRMKVSAHLNWHYMETLPIADWATREESASVADGLVESLNAVGSDFANTAGSALVAPGDRLAARLVLDALVADLYSLQPDDHEHIAAQFPIYDKDAPDHLRYPRLAVGVFRAMASDGIDAAKRRAAQLIEERRRVGCGFGLDELWEPDGGWEQANSEALAILEEAGLR